MAADYTANVVDKLNVYTHVGAQVRPSALRKG